MIDNSSAAKRHRQSEKRQERNRHTKSRVRSAVRKFVQSVDSKDKVQAEKDFRSMEQLLDSAGRKGILHKNMVSRKKSRMQKLLNKMES